MTARALLTTAALGSLALGLLPACGGGVSHRTVETAAGESITYGAPQDMTYAVAAAPEHDVARIRVTRAARCDVIPVQLLRRVEETLEGEDVVATKDLGVRQVAAQPTGSIECEESFAREAEVYLHVGGEEYRLGTTDEQGYLAVNLAGRLRTGLYNGELPKEGEVWVRAPHQTEAVSAGVLSLSSLAGHEQRFSELLAELDAILDRGASASPAEIRKSYELYEQLRALGPNDARFDGAAARFWELLYQRKQVEATENLKRNLEALNAAKDLLKGAGIAGLPVFMAAAVNGGKVEPRAVEWARWELLTGLRDVSAGCQSGFQWSRLPSYGLGRSALMAAHYLRFAFGDEFAQDASALCRRLAG